MTENIKTQMLRKSAKKSDLKTNKPRSTLQLLLRQKVVIELL